MLNDSEQNEVKCFEPDETAPTFTFTLFGWQSINKELPARGKRDNPKIADWAPKDLVNLLEQSPEQTFTPILERLLTDPALETTRDSMKNAWELIEKYGKKVQKGLDGCDVDQEWKVSPHWFFIKGICDVFQRWERYQDPNIKPNRHEIDHKLQQLAEAAKALSKQIRDAGSDYDLDEEWVVCHARIRKLQSWGMDLSQVNESLLKPVWGANSGHPTIADVIEEYAISLTDPERVTNNGLTGHRDARTSFFVKRISALIHEACGAPLHSAVADIINAVLDKRAEFEKNKPITADDVKKILRRCRGD
jgi:hypothetical protein